MAIFVWQELARSWWRVAGAVGNDGSRSLDYLLQYLSDLTTCRGRITHQLHAPPARGISEVISRPKQDREPNNQKSTVNRQSSINTAIQP
jgi:hypothetical protein